MDAAPLLQEIAVSFQITSVIYHFISSERQRHTTAYLGTTYPSDFLSFESFDKNRVVIPASTAFSLKLFARDEQLVRVGVP